MNKVMLVGRFVRDPETQQTSSGIKYSRFTIAVDRQFGENQTDFVPVVAWRSQADFVDSYLRKGALVSVEGRFTSSTYQNQENQNVTRYEVTADRVEALETKAQAAAREGESMPTSVMATQEMKFAKEQEADKKEVEAQQDVPWDLDL